MCLKAQNEKLCAWAHVPVCPTNVGRGDTEHISGTLYRQTMVQAGAEFLVPGDFL